eukprot:264872_1
MLSITLYLWIFIEMINNVSCLSSSISKPNILFILVDDLGWFNVGYHANEHNMYEISTPNIDYLRNNGLELHRHYTYFICCPSRSSFHSGRLPVHVTLMNTWPNAGIPQHMTTIGSKMKEIGFNTHYFGKWDVGTASFTLLPKNRGWDTSLIYLGPGTSYFTQSVSYCEYDNNLSDFWEHNNSYNGPAYEYMNDYKYTDYYFADRVIEQIEISSNSIDSQPFFMVYSSHIAHTSYEIPPEYLTIYGNDEDECSNLNNCRSRYQSMVSWFDESIGNITNKLHTKGLWENTLIIFASDNGGSLSSESAANNFPLRGGKDTVWEGGIRTTAFVSGGWNGLPNERRGQIEYGMIHITDWYSTFIEMFNGNSFDETAAQYNLPPIDSLNMWPMISGQVTISPRTQYIIDSTAIIQNEWKLIYSNDKISHSSWTGIIYPNSSSIHNWPEQKEDCSNGCLFNIIEDYTEHNDVSNKYPHIVNQLIKQIEIEKDNFFDNSDHFTESCLATIDVPCYCEMAQNYYKTYVGPYCDMLYMVKYDSYLDYLRKVNSLLFTHAININQTSIISSYLVDRVLLIFIIFFIIFIAICVGCQGLRCYGSLYL